MKKKFKLLLKFIITLIIAFSIALSIHGGGKTHADSGYDTSYGGGSSHSGSSSHSSSSRTHTSSSKSSSGSTSSGDPKNAGIAFVVIVIIIIILIIIINRSKVPEGHDFGMISNPAIVEKLKQIVPGFDEKTFLDNGYNIYLNVQDAWTNFDLEKIRESITDELYNQYESQLSSMEIKGEQNIMKNFVLRGAAITNCNYQNDNIEVTAEYVVEFHDYIIDKESKELKRGSKTNKVRMFYELSFVMNASQKRITHCPNCGAEVNVSTSGMCQYCGSKIVGENADWVMAKKLSKKQVNL